MDELTLRIALSMLPLKAEHQRELLQAAGSARELLHHVRDLRGLFPDASQHVCKLVASMSEQIDRAKREIEFAEQMGINILTIDDSDYPQRMREAVDAPTVLYKLGPVDLNAKHIVSIVGTRRCTPYGTDLCNNFIDELRDLIPDIVVISGLAYGIDICAHRRCLSDNVPTVGVLAHGLDTIYPNAHRTEANEMSQTGGLLTEYPSNTAMNKSYFLARNRIVAGCADATLVVESKIKGGSLTTAQLALDYNRSVFTFPGRVTDETSLGCIELIYRDVARPIVSASQFVESMGWSASTQKAVQTELFPDLDPVSQKILAHMSAGEIYTAEELSKKTSLTVPQVNSQMTILEIADIVSISSCGKIRLLRGNS